MVPVRSPHIPRRKAHSIPTHAGEYRAQLQALGLDAQHQMTRALTHPGRNTAGTGGWGDTTASQAVQDGA